MNRRTFLGFGAVAVAAASTGCATHRVRPNGVRLSVPSMDAYVAEVDAAVGRARERFGSGRSALGSDAVAAGALQQLFASLIVYDAFVELPLEGQVYPAMQRRLRDAAADFANASDALVTVIDDDALLDEVDRTLRDDRQAAREMLGEVADDIEMPLSARRRFLDLLTVASFESRTRGMAGVRDDVHAKVRPAMARGKSPQAATDADTERVRAAREEWILAGVRREEFDEEPPTWGQVRGLTALGVILVPLGMTAIGFGIAAITCPCLGVPLMLIGIGMLVGAGFAFGKAGKKRRALKEDEAEPQLMPL